MKRIRLSAIIVVLCSTMIVIGQARVANATIVEVQTSLGDFQINLYDNATPQTVANFLSYVQNGAYTNSISHRMVANFIAQGGGFQTDGNAQITAITANAAITNEPVFSNVRGTIAMAKVGGNVNSATNQWFVNLANNSANLDNQNGGFAAFGEVIGNGMDVVDAIGALPVFNFGGSLGELPLQNYTSTDFSNNVPLQNSNLVIIDAIIVVDTTVDSAGAAGLNPPRNNTVPNGGNNGGGGGGGGGTLGWLSLFALLSVRLLQRVVRRRTHLN